MNFGHGGTATAGSIRSGRRPQSWGWCQHRSWPLASRCTRIPCRSRLISAISSSRLIRWRSSSSPIMDCASGISLPRTVAQQSLGNHLEITWKSLGPAELLNGILQRTLGVAIILPWLVFFQQVWSSAHGEALRIEPRLRLIPVERHGYGRTGPGTWRQRRHRTRGEVVAQIVQKDAAGTQLLCHDDQVPAGAVVRHLRTDSSRKRLALFPAEVVTLSDQ